MVLATIEHSTMWLWSVRYRLDICLSIFMKLSASQMWEQGLATQCVGFIMPLTIYIEHFTEFSIFRLVQLLKPLLKTH